MPETTPTPALALDLALALSRVRARLRAEQASITSGLSVAQLSILGRIGEADGITATELAHLEHVRQQSMSETLLVFKKQGLVAAEPDPSDGRKTKLRLSAAGRQLLDSIVALRGSWLAQAIERETTASDRRALATATKVLMCLADSRSDTEDGTRQ